MGSQTFAIRKDPCPGRSIAVIEPAYFAISNVLLDAPHLVFVSRHCPKKAEIKEVDGET